VQLAGGEEPFFLTIAEQALFARLEEDAAVIKADIKVEAGIVHNTNALKTERVL
jgi:hypothetical protein